MIGLDRDADALALAAAVAGAVRRSRRAGARGLPGSLDAVLDARGIDRVDGVLADLGVSSLQFDAEGRGFSFRRDEPLDMRMDRSAGPTAADLVNERRRDELADVIFRFGEERHSRRIARAIVQARAARRSRRPASWRPSCGARCRARLSADRSGDAHVSGAADLGEPRARRSRSLSARTPRGGCGDGARLVVITFHSLEDRIVKHTFRALTRRRGRCRDADEAPGGAWTTRKSRATPARAARSCGRSSG